MTKRMLIDATHAEETRVVVLDGSRLEDFDVETSTKRQLKGNIYLAKVIRVEPSLQAAFVEYGGGRHGFLAFSEIHPDYYQIPVADRQRLLELQAQEAREEEEAEDEAAGLIPSAPRPVREPVPDLPAASPPAEAGRYGDAEWREAAPPQATEEEQSPGEGFLHHAGFGPDDEMAEAPREHRVVARDLPPWEPEAGAGGQPAPEHATEHATGHAAPAAAEEPPEGEAPPPEQAGDPAPEAGEPHESPEAEAEDDTPHDPRPAQAAAMEREERFAPFEVANEAPIAVIEAEPEPLAENGETDTGTEAHPAAFDAPQPEIAQPEMPPPQTVGGDTESADSAEEARQRRMSRFLRNYRIQEVVKRRQIMLVQVVKEERGTKGAALTTYISLAGRFCVLMPNSPRGGGISRKITSAADRKRLKEITAELEIPDGMGLIVRTAGANRPKAEIRRDCEYLMRLWDDIREHTMRSVAPALIYEEASLIKRAIRDVYSRDIDEITVDGEDAWRAAHDFMRMLMPSHAKKVQLWRGTNGQSQPLFAKYQVEAQLDAMLSPSVQLRSGGYIVINQTEALVAIDVNSGRATRERGIEETALRTNLEAAEEVARQLRLRDLAGLIVIDFIDMESKKHNTMVERRLTEALKVDRARIQVGHISHFGLMEMSRQRLRPSLAETSFSPCPHCGGTGHVRSVESSAIHVLRGIEDEGAKGRASLIRVHVAGAVALYLLNHKRDRLADIERRYAMVVHFEPDDSLVPPQLRIDRVRPPLAEAERAALDRAAPSPVAPAAPELALSESEEAADEATEEDGDEDAEGAAESQAEGAGGAEEQERRRKRRRRRRGGRRDQAAPSAPAEATAAPEPSGAEDEDEEGEEAEAAADAVDPSEAEQPDVEAGESEAEGDAEEQRSRRRGRRGGRRRRGREGAAGVPSAQDGADEVPPPVQPAVQPPPARPAYSGPTPANPFGGEVFDIFDIMDRVEEVRPAPAAMPAPAAPATDEEEGGATAGGEAEPLIVAPLADAQPDAAPAALALEQTAVAVAEQAEHAPEPPAAAAEPEPAPAEPAPEPEPLPPRAPLIQPVVIGEAETPPVARKRGWWRR
jgi:ribonuclease E